MKEETKQILLSLERFIIKVGAFCTVAAAIMFLAAIVIILLN